MSAEEGSEEFTLQCVNSVRLRRRFAEARVGDEAHPDLLPDELRDEWLQAQVLGKGSFGVVFEIKKIKFSSSKCALKVILPEKTETLRFQKEEICRLEREAKILDRVKQVTQSQYFVQVHDFGFTKQSDRFFIRMELLSGKSLQQILDEDPGAGLPSADCVAVARDILAALQLLHCEGLVHRDIKPSNIMRCPQFSWQAGDRQPAGHVHKLIDFGLAAGVDRDLLRSHESLATDGARLVGSFYYMSPEVRAGGGAVAASDVWSLAATIFHAATGAPPPTLAWVSARSSRSGSAKVWPSRDCSAATAS